MIELVVLQIAHLLGLIQAGGVHGFQGGEQFMEQRGIKVQRLTRRVVIAPVAFQHQLQHHLPVGQQGAEGHYVGLGGVVHPLPIPAGDELTKLREGGRHIRRGQPDFRQLARIVKHLVAAKANGNGQKFTVPHHFRPDGGVQALGKVHEHLAPGQIRAVALRR